MVACILPVWSGMIVGFLSDFCPIWRFHTFWYICHRNFGPGNFGPGDQNFQWKIGPAGPIFSGKMVRLWKIGPNNGPSISALVTSDCCG